MISYGICLSLSDLLHLVWESLVVSMLLQMALLCNFLWLISIPLCICIFLIHSSINGHLGCFCVLAIVNSAAVNIGMCVSLWIIVFSGCIPRSRIVWQLLLKHLENCVIWGVTRIIPHFSQIYINIILGRLLFNFRDEDFQTRVLKNSRQKWNEL